MGLYVFYGNCRARERRSDGNRRRPWPSWSHRTFSITHPHRDDAKHYPDDRNKATVIAKRYAYASQPLVQHLQKTGGIFYTKFEFDFLKENEIKDII